MLLFDINFLSGSEDQGGDSLVGKGVCRLVCAIISFLIWSRPCYVCGSFLTGSRPWPVCAHPVRAISLHYHLLSDGTRWILQGQHSWLVTLGKDRDTVVRVCATSLLADVVLTHEGAALAQVKWGLLPN